MGAIIKDGGCSLRFRRCENFSVFKRSLYSIDPFRSPGKISNDGNREGGGRGINEAIMTCKSSIARRPCN